MITLVRISSTDSNVGELPLTGKNTIPPPPYPQHTHILDATQSALCSIHASCQMTCLPQFSLYVVTSTTYILCCAWEEGN